MAHHLLLVSWGDVIDPVWFQQTIVFLARNQEARGSNLSSLRLHSLILSAPFLPKRHRFLVASVLHRATKIAPPAVSRVRSHSSLAPPTVLKRRHVGGGSRPERKCLPSWRRRRRRQRRQPSLRLSEPAAVEKMEEIRTLGRDDKNGKVEGGNDDGSSSFVVLVRLGDAAEDVIFTSLISPVTSIPTKPSPDEGGTSSYSDTTTSSPSMASAKNSFSPPAVSEESSTLPTCSRVNAGSPRGVIVADAPPIAGRRRPTRTPCPSMTLRFIPSSAFTPPPPNLPRWQLCLLRGLLLNDPPPIAGRAPRVYK